MYVVIYNDNKIKDIINTDEVENTIQTLKELEVISNEDEYRVFEEIENMGVKDIRAIREDGTVMSIEEQIEKEIITLEKDEELRNGSIYKLDKNVQEDLIKLIELGIEKLDAREKIETSKNGSKYITQKSYEELLKENLISQEEYDKYVIQIRQSQYSANLDGTRAELLDSVLQNLSAQGLLTEEQKSQLELLNTKRIEIKENNPKSESLLSV